MLASTPPAVPRPLAAFGALGLRLSARSAIARGKPSRRRAFDPPPGESFDPAAAPVCPRPFLRELSISRQTKVPAAD